MRSDLAIPTGLFLGISTLSSPVEAISVNTLLNGGTSVGTVNLPAPSVSSGHLRKRGWEARAAGLPPSFPENASINPDVLTGAIAVGADPLITATPGTVTSQQAERWVAQSRNRFREADPDIQTSPNAIPLEEASDEPLLGNPQLAPQAPRAKPTGPTSGSRRLQFDPQRAVFSEAPDFSNRQLPTLEEIRALQEKLRSADIPQSVRNRSVSRRTVFPGVTISNPSGYGADRGQLFAGFSWQSRTRFSGGPNARTVFGGGTPDGTMGFGIGFGDARESIGLQASYTVASFGGSRAPFSGGLNAKAHARLGENWAVAVGGEGIKNFGRLPVNSNGPTFNDFEGTYYGTVTHSIALRDDINQPFSRLTLTAGSGTGRFRSYDQIMQREFGIGVFGSAALQVLPSTSVITEWTGQDVAVGLSIAPFPNLPITLNPAFRDVAGTTRGKTSDGKPRFIFSIGGSSSLSQLFSLISSLF